MAKTLTETDILKNNIKELQRQLQQSYIRIKDLNEEKENAYKEFKVCPACGAGIRV
tara:strand:- start:1081 stop:1248 length:168 start_codon:yes stop_codon:yes gene_type:complete